MFGVTVLGLLDAHHSLTANEVPIIVPDDLL